MVLADVINKISNWWVVNSPALASLGNGMAGLSTFHSDNLMTLTPPSWARKGSLPLRSPWKLYGCYIR